MTEHTILKQTLNDRDRLPAFHITGGTGWINDPNGLVYYKGEYHVFYQYHPYGTTWGPMHWGHVVSTDLTNWKRLPVALTPGGVGDKDGCFSGTAIVASEKLFLMYTGFEENGGGENVRQVQCLAESSDGVNFTKHGVVIGSGDLPDGFMPCDFRDPHVFMKGGKFYCLVAAKKEGGKGRVLTYVSDDLFNWRFLADALGFDSSGTMFECPCYVEDQGVLMVSDQLSSPDETGCLNVHSTRYFLGKFDPETGKFSVKSEGIIDHGFDFYAPQVFSGAPENVMIAWLNMWDRNVPSAKYGFAGMLTVPRKISVDNGRLFETPVVEKREVFRAAVDEKLTDRSVIGVISITVEDMKALDIKLRKGGENYTSISLVGENWVFDRSKSGEDIVGAEKDDLSLSGRRIMPLGSKDKTEITIVLDKYSIEFFEGGRALSSTVYPPSDADGIELSVDAKRCEYVRYAVNL